MAKDRFIACEFYISERNCSAGRDGRFYSTCQNCAKYKPRANGRPAKTDTRSERLESIRRKEFRKEGY